MRSRLSGACSQTLVIKLSRLARLFAGGCWVSRARRADGDGTSRVSDGRPPSVWVPAACPLAVTRLPREGQRTLVWGGAGGSPRTQASVVMAGLVWMGLHAWGRAGPGSFPGDTRLRAGGRPSVGWGGEQGLHKSGKFLFIVHLECLLYF